MPTNSTKHRMLKEAKRIANIKYESKRKVIRDSQGTIMGEEFYPASYFMNIDIEELLEDHPEYDEDIFRGMIRTFQKKDNSDDSLTI